MNRNHNELKGTTSLGLSLNWSLFQVWSWVVWTSQDQWVVEIPETQDGKVSPQLLVPDV